MVEGGGSVHDLPLYVVGLALLLQLPNIGAQSGAALSLSLFWKPPFLKSTTSKASVMFCTVLGGDTGDINNFVLLAFWSGEGAAGGSPPLQLQP